MLTPKPIYDLDIWNTLLATLPAAHLLQTWEWGEFKRRTTGWAPQRFAYHNAAGDLVAAASVLTRRQFGLRVMYVPKGPALDYSDSEVWAGVLKHLKKLGRGAVWLKIDPDFPLGYGIPLADSGGDVDEKHPPQPNPDGEALRDYLNGHGWRFSPSQVQFRNTMLLDLTQTEDELLAGMNQSTRRKIRKAEKAGVSVREADLKGPDMATLYRLYEITGQRQGFLIRPADYYAEAWQTFIGAGMGAAFLAEQNGVAISGMVLFAFGQKAFYFYGMSDDAHRDAQPNYALQWHAIRWAKAAGYAVYDWWGAPNVFNEDDPMWGVYHFKRGFGGQVVRYMGAWDYTPMPPLYWLVERVLPQVQKLVR